jgi:hypothetical protein
VIRSLLLIAVSGTVFATGCQQKCCLNDPDRRPPRTYPAPNGSILLPPAGLPTTPGNPAPPPGPFVPSVTPNYPPPAIGPTTPNPSLKPAPEVLFPEPLPGGTSRSSYPGDPGFGVLQKPTKPATTPEPPVVPATMTGLPGFMKVEDGLASGLKPDLDGFSSLKQAGYRTVIYLYPTSTDVSAVRDLAEKRGLTFISIETTPERLAAARAEFNAAVKDKAVRPAYVFDDDRVRAGAMWYLYFLSKSMNEDAARVRAKPLGLSDRTPEGRAFELAIQSYLATR